MGNTTILDDDLEERQREENQRSFAYRISLAKRFGALQALNEAIELSASSGKLGVLSLRDLERLRDKYCSIYTDAAPGAEKDL